MKLKKQEADANAQVTYERLSIRDMESQPIGQLFAKAHAFTAAIASSDQYASSEHADTAGNMEQR